MKNSMLAAASLLVLAACGDPFIGGVDCPAIVPASVRVTVQDSVTGANVTPGATVVLHNGAVVESVVGPPGAGEVAVGGNRTGTFTVTVGQTGYQTWTKGVKVEEGSCGAQTVLLTARLKPAA